MLAAGLKGLSVFHSVWFCLDKYSLPGTTAFQALNKRGLYSYCPEGTGHPGIQFQTPPPSEEVAESEQLGVAKGPGMTTARTPAKMSGALARFRVCNERVPAK